MEHIATIKHCIEMPKDAQNKVDFKYITLMDLAGNLVPVDVKGANGDWGGNNPTVKPSATSLTLCPSCGQTLR
jgi:hypothetical protein